MQSMFAFLSVLQGWVVAAGNAAGLLTVCAGIARRELTVGDFVLFVTMARQCYAPLNFLGQYYK